MKPIYCILFLNFINLDFINAMDGQSRGAGRSGQRDGIGGLRGEGGRKRPSSQIDQSVGSGSGGQHSARQNPQEPLNTNPANELFRTSTAGQQIQTETMPAWPSRNPSGMFDRMATEAAGTSMQQGPSQAEKGKGIVDENQPQPQTQQRSTVGGLMPDARRTGTYPSTGFPQHGHFIEQSMDRNRQRIASSAARQQMLRSATKTKSSFRPSQNMSDLMNRMETGRLNNRESQAHTTATNMLMAANPANQNFRISISPLFHSGTFSESPVPGTLLCNDCNETVAARGNKFQTRNSLENHILLSKKHGPGSQAAKNLESKTKEYNLLNPSIAEHFDKIGDDAYQCKTCMRLVRTQTGFSSGLNRHIFNNHIIQAADSNSGKATRLKRYLGDRAATNHVLQKFKNEVATSRSQMIFPDEQGQQRTQSSFRPSLQIATGQQQQQTYGALESGNAPLHSVSGALQHQQTYGVPGIGNASQASPPYDFGITQPAPADQAVRPSSQLAAGSRSQFVSVASGYRQGTFGDAGGTGAAQQSHHTAGEERPSGSGAQPNPSQNPTNYE